MNRRRLGTPLFQTANRSAADREEPPGLTPLGPITLSALDELALYRTGRTRVPNPLEGWEETFAFSVLTAERRT